jgi:hypothetical protein
MPRRRTQVQPDEPADFSRNDLIFANMDAGSRGGCKVAINRPFASVRYEKAE